MYTTAAMITTHSDMATVEIEEAEESPLYLVDPIVKANHGASTSQEETTTLSGLDAIAEQLRLANLIAIATSSTDREELEAARVIAHHEIIQYRYIDDDTEVVDLNPTLLYNHIHRPRLADAWDDGYQALRDSHFAGVQSVQNPYRAENEN